MEEIQEDCSSDDQYHFYGATKQQNSTQQFQRTDSICDHMKVNENADTEFYLIEFYIKVIDKGKGISEDGLQKLFINFQSLKEHQGINKGGTGLGLSICKQLIHKMGGNVSVKSEVDIGTTFKIELLTICQLDQSDVHKAIRSLRNKSIKSEFGHIPFESHMNIKSNMNLQSTKNLQKYRIIVNDEDNQESPK